MLSYQMVEVCLVIQNLGNETNRKIHLLNADLTNLTGAAISGEISPRV